MDTVIGATGSIPNLPRQFHQPSDFQWGRYSCADGAMLRWGRLSARVARTSVVLLNGFSEFIEKYFETIGDVAAMGCDVWCLDWRGQGGSDGAHATPGRRDFDRDQADLIGFVRHTFAAHTRPVVIAHSMGAAIAMAAMARDNALFSTGVMCAPMLKLPQRPLPSVLARALAGTANVVGLGSAVVPGTRMWPPDPDLTPARSLTSSDPVRYRVQEAWMRAVPALRFDGVTFAWASGALAFCDVLRRDRVTARIGAPILLGIPGQDRFVDIDALRTAAADLPKCRRVDFPDAKHELFMEAEPIRKRWLDEIALFIDASATS